MQGRNAYIIWAVICGLGLLLSLAGEYRSKSGFSGLGKFVAASAYIAAALSLGAANSQYGRLLLVGMAFCWLGDLLLVSKNRQNLFLAGLVSFLLGHLVYIGAFVVRGISFPVLAGAAVVMAIFAWRILSWLNPVVNQRMQRPVQFYVIAISTMMAMAAATFAAHASLALLLGGLLFVISDLAVARNRFVAPGFINRAWGMPTYFTAQLLLAASVAAI